MENPKVHIFLTGFMGSGKSSLGKNLAALLKWHFKDLDRSIEEKEGLKITQIFEQKGENYFRAKEKETLLVLCKLKHASVISLGGGSIVDPENLKIVKEHGTLIYLQLTPAALFSRLKTQSSERPLLRGLSEQEMQRKILSLLQSREKQYLQADYCIQGLNLEARDIQNILIEKGLV